MIVQAIRSAIFYILFFLLTLVLVIIVALGALIPPWSRKIALSIAHFWTKANQVLLRFIVGIRTEVTGQENLPKGTCIIACKHQSDWDTIAMYPVLSYPAFIGKIELFKIPLLGTTFRLMGTIAIDRKKRGGSLPDLIKQGHQRIESGQSIFIFPEGTRKEPLASPNFRFGTAKLYEALNVPVVPVALNSGLFWGRNSLILWPGIARARILEPIEPGLSATQMHEKMSADIEKVSTELILQAVEEGLSRPIDPELQKRIALAISAKVDQN
jgi:1-acyl-sn-glycerol-3-phosphate acyltransferase